MPTYICSEDQHNKEWSYELRGNTVATRWGRVGGHMSTQTKSFSSPYEAERFAQKKAGEKLAKGYKEVTSVDLEKERKVAQALGQQFKIQRMLWVANDGKKLTELAEYDPNKAVYVELLNSWSKEVFRLVLSKNSGVELSGGSGMNFTHTFASPHYHGVKEALQIITQGIRKVVVSIFGQRVLSLGDESDDVRQVTEQLEKSGSAAVSRQAVSKIMSLGGRVLDL